MKFARVLALALVGVILAFSMASCGGEPVQKLTVKVQAYSAGPEAAGDDNLVINVDVPLESSAPTVLEAVQEAFIVNEISYRLSDDETSIADIKEFVDYTEKDTGIAHYWMYYLNGVEPTTGKANANAIVDGDVITYYYVEFDPATVKK